MNTLLIFPPREKQHKTERGKQERLLGRVAVFKTWFSYFTWRNNKKDSPRSLLAVCLLFNTTNLCECAPRKLLSERARRRVVLDSDESGMLLCVDICAVSRYCSRCIYHSRRECVWASLSHRRDTGRPPCLCARLISIADWWRDRKSFLKQTFTPTTWLIAKLFLLDSFFPVLLRNCTS